MQIELIPAPLELLDARGVERVAQATLRIWGSYFLRRVKRRFQEQGPGWAPRKIASDAQKATREGAVRSLAEHRLRRKLEREFRRASQRFGRGKGTLASVQRRAAVMRELDRQLTGGQVQTGKGPKMSGKDAAIAGLQGPLAGDRRLQKSVAGLRERMARAGLKDSEPLLGGIGGSIGQKLARGMVTIASKIPWAGVHNEGGRAGRSAVIPERSFLYVDSEDVEVLVEIWGNALEAEMGKKS